MERPDDGSSQRSSTFVRNHAGAVLARDFFVVITAMCWALHVFVVLKPGSRRIVHWNVTEHPRTPWTIQQFRAIVPGDPPQRFLIHNRDSVFASAVDDAVTAMGDSRAMPAGERVLRAADRHHASGVPGLADPVE
jgi:putative transposase